jgi:NAD(P)-dependent dehydrogenase (short-subunit alcohol dehydrogenase family)
MTGMPDSWSLAGKVAVVTGAARGIGRETVRLVVARGAQVVATDVRQELGALASERVATWQVDVGTRMACGPP